VLWILNIGAQWHMHPQSYPNYKTVHRRFQQWCQSEMICAALTELANVLREEGSIDETECNIDVTFASAKGGGDEIWPTRREKGVEIVAIVNRYGLPLAVTTHAANHYAVALMQRTFDFYMIEAKTENLISDKSYEGDQLDATMRAQGAEMISPHCSNKKRKTQDGRRLPGYERRWFVERFFAWIQWQRRFLVRWEYYPTNFLSFVQLAALCILLKRF